MTRAPRCGAGTRAPLAVLRPWALGAAAISVALLAAVWVVAHVVTPDPTRLPHRRGSTSPRTVGAVGHVLFRNSLVLALHAMACVAGFIAGSSLPLQAEHHHGWWRTVHEKAGPAAIVFVAGATTFSLCTQAYVLGNEAATLAQQLEIGRATLMLTLLPHALPELVALFLPLAAWMLASRREAWNELLAATARDHRHRRPRCSIAGSERRGLRLAPPAAPRLAGRCNAATARRYWSLHFV